MSSVAEDAEEEEEHEAFQQQLHQWQKTDAKAPRPSYVFKTVDELKESSKKVPYKKVQRKRERKGREELFSSSNL